jgi:hypothetical protein
MLSPLDPAALLLWPSAAHLALTAFLYLWLTGERAAAVIARRNRYDDFIRSDVDQGRGARVAANLRNQFEAPPFFHMLILALVLAGEPVVAQLILAWMFVAGRIAHTLVQTLTGNVLLRGAVFSINFLALCGMWVIFFVQMFNSA